jgi:hypothetical protein
MAHSEKVTAVVTDNEPPDGSKLVIISEDGGKVIWRDDATAADSWGPGDPHKQRWFEDHDEDPMSLHEHLKYADAVYALGEPLAVFS